MKMMQRTMLILLALLLSGFQALALEVPTAQEALMPSGAVISNDQTVGEYRVLTLNLPLTGEQLMLTLSTRTDAALSIITEIAAAPADPSTPQARDAAEAIVLTDYPDARILFANDAENGTKALAVISEALCGEITVGDDIILSRNLTCGSYVQNGYFTMDGALAALKLHRPEAVFQALELDEDDGQYVYEGDAYVSGVEYEFELDARTGKLLEWERD